MGTKHFTLIALIMGFSANCAQAAQVYSHYIMGDESGTYMVTTLARPRLPLGASELPRILSAADWAAPFCAKWTDGCLECSGSALDNQVRCKERLSVACVHYPVQCKDFDAEVAPLYCAEVSTECEELAWFIDPNSKLREKADIQTCGLERVPRPHHIDWQCISFQQHFQSCKLNGDSDIVDECLEGANEVAKAGRENLLRILRESESLAAKRGP